MPLELRSARQRLSRKPPSARRPERQVSGSAPAPAHRRWGKNPETFGELLAWGQQELRALGAVEARSSTELILQEITGRERLWLYVEPGRAVSSSKRRLFLECVRKRKARMPVAYIFGRTAFWNEMLEVGPECLIPRPETEILVESFLRHSGFGKNESFSFLDLGAGSGAIGIALLREFPRATAVFADVSPKALAVARRNLARYRLLGRAKLVRSNLFSAFARHGDAFDAILCNPPYVAQPELERLEPEVLREPKLALVGGEDGLDFYRWIAAGALRHLRGRKVLALEFGRGQARAISAMLGRLFSDIKVYKDYAGLERVILATER